MSEALTKFGVKNLLITIPNGENSFDQDMQKPVVAEAFEQVIAFLKKNLQ